MMVRVVVVAEAPTAVTIGVGLTLVTIAVAGRVVVVAAAPVIWVAIGLAPATVAPALDVPVMTTPAMVAPGTVAPGAAVTGELGVPNGVSNRANPVVVVVVGETVVVGATVAGTGARVLVPGSVIELPAGGIVARVLVGVVVGELFASAGALDLSGTGAPSSPPKT